MGSNLQPKRRGLEDLHRLETIWEFPKKGVPQNGWFIIENPIEMDDLGGKPIIFGNIHLFPQKKGVSFSTKLKTYEVDLRPLK